jgi:hypothetical protein
VLSSPGLAPASLLPQLSAASQRAAAAEAASAAAAAARPQSPRGAARGAGGPQFRLGDTVVVGTHQRTRGVIK